VGPPHLLESPAMQLLLSVRDAAEAIEAAGAGAHIIDVKDPATGALGRPAPGVVRAIRAVVPDALPVSVALGDGPFEPHQVSAGVVSAATEGATFVKVGLRDTPPARALVILGTVRAALPPAARLIVAGFADSTRAGSPRPGDLPVLAEATGAGGCLLDTAIKDGRGLYHWLDDAALAAFVNACRARGLLSALAGSLTVADLPRLALAGPDIVGVRGAACDGDRVHGAVSARRVREIRAALDALHTTTTTRPRCRRYVLSPEAPARARGGCR
jgi:(5-formylfuran-3-yl)methyl phosphate synthase